MSPNAFPNTETILHRLGYATEHRGKWHLATFSDFAAGNTGDFACYESRNYLGKTDEEYRKFLDERLPADQFAGIPAPGKYLDRPVEMIPAMEKAYSAILSRPPGVLAYVMIIGRSVIPPELLPETRITDDALRLLEQHAHERFMITVSWSPPHDVWVIPEPYYSMVDRRKIDIRGSATLPTGAQPVVANTSAIWPEKRGSANSRPSTTAWSSISTTRSAASLASWTNSAWQRTRS